MAIPNLMQQAKQAMELRSQMKKIHKELEAQTVDYENAGVVVTARGDMTLSRITINPEVVDLTRLDKLERTILENSNKALKKVRDQATVQMQKVTKGMGLEGLLGG